MSGASLELFRNTYHFLENLFIDWLCLEVPMILNFSEHLLFSRDDLLAS